MLSVTTSNIFSFPASIGRLKHLRYLAFRAGRVKLVFPSTFTNLYHLQVLDIGGCKELVFSSGEDINLLNLRHVISSADLNFRNIGGLTSLQTLSVFTAKKGPGYELQQLKHLSKLRGRLEMHGLENVQSKEEALEANLASKERLKQLALVWDKDTCCPEVQAEVLEGLYPPPELEKLEITNYHGSRYPDWMVGKQKGPKNLHILCLRSCSGLGSSQKLSEFVNLRSLGLYNCSWNALPDNMEQLTSLQTLAIYECRNSVIHRRGWCGREGAGDAGRRGGRSRRAGTPQRPGSGGRRNGDVLDHFPFGPSNRILIVWMNLDPYGPIRIEIRDPLGLYNWSH